MDIPKKFQINTDDFKIYFDNDKKTHVCENIETGEKTNIGFFGILLQMGIIKAIEEERETTMKNISERLETLEMKIENLAKAINEISIKPTSTQKSEESVEEKEEKSKSDIKERIMKNVLGESEEPKEESDEEPSKEETQEEESESDVVVESEEEIDTWSEI